MNRRTSSGMRRPSVPTCWTKPMMKAPTVFTMRVPYGNSAPNQKAAHPEIRYRRTLPIAPPTATNRTRSTRWVPPLTTGSLGSGQPRLRITATIRKDCWPIVMIPCPDGAGGGEIVAEKPGSSGQRLVGPRVRRAFRLGKGLVVAIVVLGHEPLKVLAQCFPLGQRLPTEVAEGAVLGSRVDRPHELG